MAGKHSESFAGGRGLGVVLLPEERARNSWSTVSGLGRVYSSSILASSFLCKTEDYRSLHASGPRKLRYFVSKTRSSNLLLFVRARVAGLGVEAVFAVAAFDCL